MIKIRFTKGYPYQLIGTADLKTNGHDLTGRTCTAVDSAAGRALACRWHKLRWALTPWPTVHENKRGFFLRHHGGKVISSYSPFVVEAVYNELAMAVRLALLLRSACDGSESSPTSKVGERWWQLLLKLIGYFNSCGRRWRLDCDGTLGFRFL
jgi:hypothetical protein